MEAKQSFEAIKEALTKTLVLISPNFNKDIIIFFFHFKAHHCSNLAANEQPRIWTTIAFFSKSLRDGTLKYNIMEKKALALVKTMKDFRVYIMYSHIIA